MVKFDYDKTYRKGRLICDESTLKFVRNHFSIKDKNAAFVNRKSFGRKIPDRKYAVQATGLFDFGLHQEIRKFLIDKQINDIQFTDSFNNHLKVGYDVQDLFDGLKYELRDYQKESVEESLRIGSGTNVLATSAGKCYGKGTKILKYDGSVELVENLKVGDELIGPDSRSKTIVNLVKGEEMLYEITPIRYADPVIVNESHILALKVTGMGKKRLTGPNGEKYKSGDLVCISVKDYLKSSKNFKHCTKWHQSSADFELSNEILEIPPYLLGMWLGDGSCSGSQISKTLEYESAIRDECDKAGWLLNIQQKIKEVGCVFNISGRFSGHVGLFVRLRELNLLKNKHIPHKYLTHSRENRMELWSGLIDSDGSIHKTGVEFTNTNYNLVEGMMFLSRSLGMSVSTPNPRYTKSQDGTICKSWRLHIQFDCEIKTRVKIPPKRSKLRTLSYTGFSIEPIGVGEYYGFNLDGEDRLHLLGDFSVAHNSLIQAALIENISRIHPKFKCILIVPGLSLVNQLVQDFKDYNVTFTYSGWTGDLSLQDTSVVITNSENLNAKFGTNKWITEVDVVVVDECHRANCSSTLSKVVSKIKTPNKFGFTGTLPPDDLDRWKVIGTFGPVIYEKKSKELRDEGYISNVMIRILKLIHPKSKKKTYQDEITYLVEHEGRNKIIRNLVKKFEKNCLILVNTLDHGHILNDILQLEGKETVFIHGGIPVDERDIIKSRMELNDNIICIAMSSIFSTGINIKNIHYIIFVSGGKSFIRIVQSIGRGLRLHSDKSRLVLFDVCDNLKYSENHLEERKIFYNDEEISFKETTINLI